MIEIIITGENIKDIKRQLINHEYYWIKFNINGKFHPGKWISDCASFSFIDGSSNNRWHFKAGKFFYSIILTPIPQPDIDK